MMPSSFAFSRIHRFCSSVRVNERGAVFSGVFVCSRMTPLRGPIIYYLRDATRFPGGKPGFVGSLTASHKALQGPTCHKGGGGFAASNDELTGEGPGGSLRLFTSPNGDEKKMGWGRVATT